MTVGSLSRSALAYMEKNAQKSEAEHFRIEKALKAKQAIFVLPSHSRAAKSVVISLRLRLRVDIQRQLA